MAINRIVTPISRTETRNNFDRNKDRKNLETNKQVKRITNNANFINTFYNINGNTVSINKG